MRKISTFLILLFSINTMSFSFAGDTKDWTIVATYDIPGKASGLAWDGTYIYFGIYGANGDMFYKFDPSDGTNTLLFSAPAIGDCFGLTHDGTNLWLTDHVTSSSVPAAAIEIDMSGNIQSQFDLPDHYMSGIAYDNGDFWVATYYPDPGTIYKVDGSGNILNQFQAPDEQPWDICLEGNDLWVADYYGDMLYKIDNTGAMLESHACENIKPSGIVFDGQYLWYVDGELNTNSTLYKVSLTGGGTPQITVPTTTYNYGVVALDDSVTWNCTVNNTGSADLEISGLVIQNAVPIFNYQGFPLTIPIGGSESIDLVYKPTEPGNLNTVVTINSNDPVTPTVDLTLEGEAVYDGPHIVVQDNSHNFGSVRANATTRWFIEVYNDGNQNLEITDITIDDEHFYLDDMVSFPLNVGVLQTENIGIWFHPEEATSYNATTVIEHNDGTQGNIDVSLEGSGVEMDYPIGENFWQYTINTSWDNSVKGLTHLPDVTGDGVSEAIVCSEDDFIRAFNGNSHQTADMLWEIEAGSVYGQNGITTIEDIDGDGFDDVIAGLAWGVRAIKAISGKTGEQLWIYDTHIYGDGGWVYQVSAEYDYNQDGTTDVLASTGNDGSNTGPKRIFCLDGTDGSLIWDNNTNGPNFAVIGISDFTGDNLPDVLAGASTNDESQGMVYGIDGSNGSTTWSFNASSTSVWALEQLDDINEDGVKDVVAGDFGGNYFLLDATTGNSLGGGTVGTSLLLRAEVIGDANGDGFADFSLGHSGTLAFVIDGKTGANIWATSLADKCWNIDVISDITGDGINDLVAGTLFSNNKFYFLDGISGDVLFSGNYSSAIDAISVITDINGDGSWEMLVGGRDGELNCYSGGLNSDLVMADFEADITSGLVPLTVQFNSQSTGNLISWEWDFDNDGTIDSNEENPTFTYENTGIYSVSLMVSNEYVTDTMVKNDYIVVDTINTFVVPEHATNISAHPNPFNNFITITVQANQNESNTLFIYSQEGKLVKKLMPISFQNKTITYRWNGCNQDGLNLGKGIFYAKSLVNEKVEIIKLIKQ